ncbi:hypothetical protein vBAcoSR7M_12 [Alteromonas phage vB_AcoS-R7M]|uniref:Uncharacterized protein n=1 Tax=Alteromonas phage vB_AcoS-R7M TaxID=2729541 RepID=A0A6M3YR69_9CAUD|nr:hypothetical protein HWD34_gp12 [Alteromonas phage vB_AcoS-R7M]QJI53334.1 hypothetical protein vBAcoSR7M_12 [Alteromonas phage vB_AcoS-R7M]
MYAVPIIEVIDMLLTMGLAALLSESDRKQTVVNLARRYRNRVPLADSGTRGMLRQIIESENPPAVVLVAYRNLMKLELI